MKQTITKVVHPDFTDRPGDPGIYTGKGDYVGTIEDDDLRNEAIMGLNGEICEGDEREILEFLDENDIDLEGIKELIEIKEKHEAVMENVDGVETDLSHLLDCSLLDGVGENEYDFISDLVKKVKQIEQTVKVLRK